MGNIFAKKAVQKHIVQGEIPVQGYPVKRHIVQEEIPDQGYPVQGEEHPGHVKFSDKRRRWVERCIGDF
jgi:hypothetical protein